MNRVGFPIRAKESSLTKQAQVTEYLREHRDATPKEIYEAIKDKTDIPYSSVTTMAVRARKQLLEEIDEEYENEEAERGRCSACDEWSDDVEEIHGRIYCQNCI